MQYSVIVPIYKVEPYLKKCIESILSQTYSDFELILVDDGSPDGCPRICDEYQKKDPRVVVIHKPNGGLVSARNAGLSIARGDYVCYVDGDDWIKENLMETVLEKAIHPYAPGMVMFGIERIYEDGSDELVDPVPEGIYEKKALNDDIYPRMIYDPARPFCKGAVFPAACNKIYKRELLLEHHCRDERIRMGEDNAFTYECLVFSESVYFCHDLLYCYNKTNEASMSTAYDPNRFQNNAYLTAYLEAHLNGISETIDLQVNAFKAYWLIMAVFHEMKCKRGIGEASAHIKKEIQENRSLDGISPSGLPRFARAYIAMLRMGWYALVLLATKLKLAVRP